MHTRTSTCAHVATIGVTAFVTIMYVAFLFIRPELNPLERYGSEYAVGRMGWLMVTGFICLATSVAALALGLAMGLDRHARSRIGIVLMTEPGGQNPSRCLRPKQLRRITFETIQERRSIGTGFLESGGQPGYVLADSVVKPKVFHVYECT